MKPYGIDHLVHAVADLASARESFAQLGFTVAPKAIHPFGTANSVIQLEGAYLELLGVHEPAAIPEPTATIPSFAAFNHDFLAGGEGVSMLARRSDDAGADQRDFAARDLINFAPLDFERVATGPDGIERKVAFSLAMTGDERLPRAGFFSCRHHHPENFWRDDLKRHANGARRLASAVFVAPDPADFHEFVTLFSGQHLMSFTGLGITFEFGDNRIEILNELGFSAFFGEDGSAFAHRFGGYRVAVDDLAATEAYLKANAVPCRPLAGQLVVPAEAAHGAAIAFVQDG